MNRLYIPKHYSKTLKEIDPQFFLDNGYHFLLCDLDNTLDPYCVDEPQQDAIETVKRLLDAGLRFVIVSNNSPKRVGHYAKLLGVDYLCYCAKPFAKKIRKFLIAQRVDLSTVILIGDQLSTDIPAANRLGVASLLTEPLYEKEPIWTRFNRLFDRPRRKKLKERKMLRYWNEEKMSSIDSNATIKEEKEC